jgi:CO/xanthine dehydrogenase Mo-binding subunit
MSDQVQTVVAETRAVGRRTVRLDAPEKVTGRAQFTGDIKLPGLLHAALVKSHFPKGRIVSVDGTDALTMRGVHAVITAADLRSQPIGCREPLYGVVVRDRPALADAEVRYVGEPVAVVIAETPDLARGAASVVAVDIEPLPAAGHLEEALAEAAPLVHTGPYEREGGGVYGVPLPLYYGQDNVVVRYETSAGDVERALGEAAKRFEGTYRFPAVYHYAMEPYCVVASVSDRRMTVWSTAQHPYQVSRDLARMFGHSLSDVRVISSYVGGGFGSKSFTHVEPLAVAAAKAVGRPVKLELDISESMATSRRHNAVARVRTGVDSSGRVIAYDVDLLYDSGAYTLLGPYVAVKGAFRALGGYSFPNYRVRSRLVYTNTSPAGSFRAIGAPQAAWALESQLDEVAAELKEDRIAFRRRHVAARGEEFRAGRTPMDADLDEGLAKLDALRSESSPPAGPDVRVGWGAAMGLCDPGASPVSSAIIKLTADGSVTVTIGSSELGQGVRTAVAQIVADTMGVAFEHVSVLPTDTGYGPYDASTGASRSTTMSGLAVQRAAQQVVDRTKALAAGLWSCDRGGVDISDGIVTGPGGERRDIGRFVRDHFGHDGGNFFGIGEVTNSEFPTSPPFWEVAGAAATVSVDVETGEVRVLDYCSFADLGKVVNPTAMEGQEEGAMMQGLGHTLFEAMLWEEGQPGNNSLIDYRVPRFADAPASYRSTFVENEDGPGPFGLKGGGEGAIVPVGGAIGSAVYDACGVRIRELPLTPERVWSALVDAGIARDYGRE